MYEANNPANIKKQNKAILTAFIIAVIGVLAGSFFNILNNNVDKVGSMIFYTLTFLILLAATSYVAFIIYYFVVLRTLSIHKRYFIATLFVMVCLCCYGFMAKNYVLDLLQKPVFDTTNEYSVIGSKKLYIEILDNDNNIKRIHISPALALNATQNPVVEDNPISANHLQYHTNQIAIEYYPNTKILKKLKVLY